MRHGADVIPPSPAANPLFDTIPLTDAPNAGTPIGLDYELYGVSPLTQATSDPGAYDVFNGAAIRFDDAYNVALYALLSYGALDTNPADYFDGTHITDALAGGTATYAFDYFYDYAIGDLSGFFGTNLSFLDIALPALS
ncbi:hypothetical protein [Mycobacterium paraterrae]|uniref:PE-PPE domain-containing protein n=1 Tax=Mycobacterium paraterrae TaxID=577492 RepID=A0ABY3VSC2_9MYCO|nr:hypothetical protein [Mycobacterium paraterrae]UMB71304.1 hypothetical protein MKK62_08685 [Mycobacterium paraterrae]